VLCGQSVWGGRKIQNKGRKALPLLHELPVAHRNPRENVEHPDERLSRLAIPMLSNAFAYPGAAATVRTVRRPLS
jgi:hypothetical protein